MKILDSNEIHTFRYAFVFEINGMELLCENICLSLRKLKII